MDVEVDALRTNALGVGGGTDTGRGLEPVGLVRGNARISDGLGKSLARWTLPACSIARRDDDDDGDVLGIYAYVDDLPTHVVCAFVWIGRGAHVLFRVNYALRCVKCPCPITKVRFAGMRY